MNIVFTLLKNLIKSSTLFVLVLLLVFVADSFGKNYYISQSSGSDSNSGLSPEHPWKTTSKVNSITLRGGDSVLFKRGDIWTYNDGDYLRMRSGSANARLVYGAYGEGSKPVISRSLPANNSSQWIDVGSNIWRLSEYVEGVHFNTAFISYNSDSVIGFKRFNYSDMKSQGDFYTEERKPDPSKHWIVHNYTYVYSVGNPALFYDKIDVVTGQSGIAGDNETTGVSNIVIQDINFYQCGWNGIGIPHNSSNILIDNCDVSYCGGQRQVNNNLPDARRGQCINTQGNIQNFEVRNCVVSQGWDGGIALQGWRTNLRIRDVWIHHNIIYKNEYGFETWGVEPTSDVKHVYLENNTFLYNGYGWAYDHRKPHKKRGSGFFTWSYAGVAEHIYVRNNIFYKDKAPSFYVWNAKGNGWKNSIFSDYNLYFDGSPANASEGEKALWFTDYTPTADGNWNNPSENKTYLYRADEYESWKIASGGFDENSIIEQEPLFLKTFPANSDSFNYDLRLVEGSPAIGSGMYLEKYVNMADRWGIKPGSDFNVGAYNGGCETIVTLESLSEKGHFKIYPNPVRKVLNIEIKDNIPTEFFILDARGRVIIHEKFVGVMQTIDVSKLSSGLYFLQINMPNQKTESHLIIKQ